MRIHHAEWDALFNALLAAPSSKAVAYLNVVEMLRARTPEGFVGDPNVSAGHAVRRGRGKVAGDNGFRRDTAIDAAGKGRWRPGRGVRAQEITVDNGALGYTVVSGSWPTGTGMAGYYGGNYASHAPGDGSSQVLWQPGLPGDGRYEVQVSCTAASNRSPAAPYTITHVTVTVTVTVPVDQTVLGNPDPEAASLGTYTFVAGPAASVTLTDTPSGYVVADVGRFIRR